MRLHPRYASVFSPSVNPTSGIDDAVSALQASLRSTAALRAILECARQRAQNRELPHTRLKQIERMCVRYEEHHKAVRDHCLDVYNAHPGLGVDASASDRTDALVRASKSLYADLREVILTF